MMWAMTIVQKPRVSPTWLNPWTKMVSSDAPRTISGVAMGTKTRTFPAPLPLNECRTSAKASIVPRMVATIVAMAPTRMEVPSASQIPGGPHGFIQCSNVGEPSGFHVMFDFL